MLHFMLNKELKHYNNFVKEQLSFTIDVLETIPINTLVHYDIKYDGAEQTLEIRII